MTDENKTENLESHEHDEVESTDENKNVETDSTESDEPETEEIKKWNELNTKVDNLISNHTASQAELKTTIAKLEKLLENPNLTLRQEQKIEKKLEELEEKQTQKKKTTPPSESTKKSESREPKQREERLEPREWI